MCHQSMFFVCVLPPHLIIVWRWAAAAHLFSVNGKREAVQSAAELVFRVEDLCPSAGPWQHRPRAPSRDPRVPCPPRGEGRAYTVLAEMLPRRVFKPGCVPRTRLRSVRRLMTSRQRKRAARNRPFSTTMVQTSTWDVCNGSAMLTEIHAHSPWSLVANLIDRMG